MQRRSLLEAHFNTYHDNGAQRAGTVSALRQGGGMEALQDSDPPSVGKYHLIGRLGVGGMGIVYLGRSQGGRLVAIKVIRPELAGDPEFRERFRQEVAATQKVRGFYTASFADA